MQNGKSMSVDTRRRSKMQNGIVVERRKKGNSLGKLELNQGMPSNMGAHTTTRNDSYLRYLLHLMSDEELFETDKCIQKLIQGAQPTSLESNKVRAFLTYYSLYKAVNLQKANLIKKELDKEVERRKRKLGGARKGTTVVGQIDEVTEKHLVRNLRTSPLYVQGLLNSMDLDELLEAGQLMEMPIDDEACKSIESDKVRDYVLIAKRLGVSEEKAELLKHSLNEEIVKKNEDSFDMEEATQLYNKFIEEA